MLDHLFHGTVNIQMAGKTKPIIGIVIAAYNEAATIAGVVEAVKKYSHIVVVVDDCSVDDTGILAAGAGAVVITHAVNLGQGAALQTGFEYFKRYSKVDAVVTYDADDQFNASEIPLVYAPVVSNKADIVLGSRFLGKAVNMPMGRLIVLKLGIFFTWIFSDVTLSDTHNGFRALSPKALNSISIQQNRMAHASEIIDQIMRYKLRYVEVPVTVRYDSDRPGQGNLGLFSIIRDLLLEKFS